MAQADWGNTETFEAQAAVSGDKTAVSQPGSSSFVNIVGAVLSLALLVGLGVWGYRLAVRDVSGVPVVRALEGPMRIQPDDPGGEAAAYQGYSVNNVQADGQAEAPADRLALAPRNIGLLPGDAPADPNARVSALIPDETPPAEMAVSGPARPVMRPEAGAETGAGEAVAVAQDPAPEISAMAAGATGATETEVARSDQPDEGDEPLSAELTGITPTASASAQATQEAVNQAVASVALGPEIIAASVPGVARSPRPAHRPDGFAQQAATVAAAAAAAAGAQPQSAPAVSASAPVAVAGASARTVPEANAADIPVGTRLVQLGAFDSPEVARAEWDKLAGRFEDYLVGKTRVVQQASSGGKTFYRLRALGFDDLSEARRFCAVLMAGKAACIPVVTR